MPLRKIVLMFQYVTQNWQDCFEIPLEVPHFTSDQCCRIAALYILQIGMYLLEVEPWGTAVYDWQVLLEHHLLWQLDHHPGIEEKLPAQLCLVSVWVLFPTCMGDRITKLMFFSRQWCLLLKCCELEYPFFMNKFILAVELHFSSQIVVRLRRLDNDLWIYPEKTRMVFEIQ